MTSALPSRDSILLELEFELVTWDQPDIVTFVREHEVGNALV